MASQRRSERRVPLRSFRVVPLAVVLALGCKKKPPAPQAIDAGVNLTAASAPGSAPSGFAGPATPAPKEAEKPACPPIDPAKVAAYECPSNVVKTPMPSIDDPDGNMARFYDRVAELARGTAKTRVRIGVYGDSNLTSDFLTAHLRRTLQGRYGDG